MDTALLCARVEDALDLANKQSRFKSLGFLNEQEAATVNKKAKSLLGRYCFFGGYENALRVMFIALPEWAEDETGFDGIESVTFLYNKAFSLTHRDFLGTLMSLGITREKVGDILVENGRTVVFLSKDVSAFVQSQISKVGGVGVTVCLGHTLPLPNLSKLAAFSVTVASLRLDSVVSALTGLSREKAKELILASFVSQNGFTAEKITAEVRFKDKLSIRGYGRFVIDECCEHSKKGRVILNYSKYI